MQMTSDGVLAVAWFCSALQSRLPGACQALLEQSTSFPLCALQQLASS